jgi:hypothetical protein
MMKMSDALSLIEQRRDDAVVLPTMTGGSAWNRVSHDESHLGSVVTIAGKAPENLYHFVLDNGVYAVTGGQPVPNAGGYSFAGIAREAGYAAAYEFDNLEDFATSVDEIFGTKGPVLVSLKTEPEIENTPIQLRPRSSRRTPQAIKELKETLSR